MTKPTRSERVQAVLDWQLWGPGKQRTELEGRATRSAQDLIADDKEPMARESAAAAAVLRGGVARLDIARRQRRLERPSATRTEQLREWADEACADVLGG